MWEAPFRHIRTNLQLNPVSIYTKFWTESQTKNFIHFLNSISVKSILTKSNTHYYSNVVNSVTPKRELVLLLNCTFTYRVLIGL